MRNSARGGLAVVAGTLLVVLVSGRGAGQGVDTPVRDEDGVEIGRFEKWGRRRIGRKQFREPKGWLGMLNGSLGLSLFQPVRTEFGLSVKGSVKRKLLHGRPVHFQPSLAAGRELREERINIGGADGVPVSQRHASLRGVFQFKPIRGSGFAVQVQMERDGRMIGQGRFISKERTRTWTEFNIPIQYFGEEVPDRCFIAFDILGRQQGNTFESAVNGTFYLLDNVVFSD